MHTSCVNSLTLSSGDGRFLASGGDGAYSFKCLTSSDLISYTGTDPFVYLWDLHQDELTQPTCGFIGHKVSYKSCFRTPRT